MTGPAAAYIFPGQASQEVGMGRDLYESFTSARRVFEQADETLGFPLSRLCFEGPEDELTKTINAQPALVTVSFACLQAAREASSGRGLPPAAFVAGHSLGEYTALAAADVLDFATTVHLARERGRLMYEAGLVKPGGMMAVIGLDETVLTGICTEAGVWLANINCPGQLVISGAVEDLPKAAKLAEARGAQRVIPLQVSGAFHTPLMQPAVDGMSPILTAVSFREPSVPIIANTMGEPIASAAAIRAELLQQLCHVVHWQRSVEYMIAGGVSAFLEIGPKKVLSSLVKRINKSVRTVNIDGLPAIRSLGI